MSRKAAGTALALGSALLLSFASITGCSRPAPGSDIQNVILLSVDALSPKVLPFYDARASDLPHLERFARRAVVFRNAFSPASWTLPAHASLFTGLYPDRHGAVGPGKRMSEAQGTIASRLHARNFETVAFTGDGFLSGSYGFGKGFDRYDGWTKVRGWRPQLRLHQAGAQDGRLFDRAVAYLRDAASGERRFLLFLHTYFVHDYYKSETEELKECVLGRKSCGAAVWEDLENRYRNRVARFDRGFGRLIAALEETGLDETTLFVLLSDHGEGFEPERGRIHHGGRLHEDLTRIPLLIAGPHIRHRFADARVSLVDVVPTLAELLDFPVEEQVDGSSFAEHLQRDSTPRDSGSRTLLAMEHAYSWRDGARIDGPAPEDGPLSSAVIHRNLYYIREGDREEIYDMRGDPEQWHDIGRGLDLTGFRRAVEAREGFEPGGEVLWMDRELENRLRSLGYIE